MTLQISNAAITAADFSTLKDSFTDKNSANGALIVFNTWVSDTVAHNFADASALAAAIKLEMGKRENYFFQQEGENLNIDKVIFKSVVPTSSIGWSEPEFFKQLGHPGNTRYFGDAISSKTLADGMKSVLINEHRWLAEIYKQALRRRAEQEYLLQNMVKGAMWDASEVATEFNVGIAVRGTGLLAHMGIESGDPTKAQEFKNKTSKEIDLILCDEIEANKIGSVVHYDPRIEWSSQKAEAQAKFNQPPMFQAPATEIDWNKKKATLKSRMAKLGPRVKEPTEDALKVAFTKRSKEYMAEDYEYRKGHYAPFTTLVGPYIRLKLRPDVNMVGDHDLFAFTFPEADKYGDLMPDNQLQVAKAQSALQNSQGFQAQHGGIWYWQPSVEFNVGIKKNIMGGHGPEGPEPLVYIRPGGQVSAAFYNTEDDKLESVWEHPASTEWLKTTHSGGLLVLE